MLEIPGLEVKHGSPERVGKAFFLYGPTGGGKSNMGATALLLEPKLENVWIYCDANSDGTLEQFPGDNLTRIYISRYIVDPDLLFEDERYKRCSSLTTKKLMKEVFEEDGIDPLAFYRFQDACNAVFRMPEPPGVVVIDSDTGFSDMALDAIHIRNGMRPVRDATQIKQWGEQTKIIMADLSQKLQALAKQHDTILIVIAHDKLIEFRGEDAKIGTLPVTVGIEPSTTGKTSRIIGKEFEEMYYLDSCTVSGSGTTKSGWQARTRGTGIIKAKTQISTLPDILECGFTTEGKKIGKYGMLDMRYIMKMREEHLKRLKEGR